MQGSTRSGRRRFLKSLGAAGVSSVLLGAAWSAAGGESSSGGSGSGGTPAAPGAAGSRGTADAAQVEPSKTVPDEARALAAVVKARYGAHLTGEQLEAVTAEIADRLEGGRKLRERRLRNADEPDVTFSA